MSSNQFTSATVDPADASHVLASLHGGSACFGEFAPLCLAESMDAGAHWQLVRAHPDADAGGDGVWSMIINPTNTVGADIWYHSTGDSWGLYRTTDRGLSWDKVYDENPVYARPVRAANGQYFMGTGRGILRSDNGLDWTEVQFGMLVFTVATSATHVYAGYQNAHLGGDYYRSAPIADALNPSAWKTFTTAGQTAGIHGPPYLTYDSDRGILYSSNWTGGVWRIRAP
jgi:hypothetical protein